MTDEIQVPSEAPLAQVAEAVLATVENPNLPIMASDLALIINLVNGVKTALAGKHPAYINIFNYFLGLK